MPITGTNKAKNEMTPEEIEASLTACQAHRGYLQSLGTPESRLDLRELDKDEQNLRTMLETAQVGENTATGVGIQETADNGKQVNANTSGDTKAGAGDSAKDSKAAAKGANG